MTKRLVDIDDTLLTSAQELLGAETMKETVNRALEEVINLDRRRRFLQRAGDGDVLDVGSEATGSAWH